MTVMEPVVAWLIACTRKKVTLKQVMEGADRPRKPVLRVMDRLVREGYLEEIADDPETRKKAQFGRDPRNPTWKILSKPLSMPKLQAQKRTARDKIWQLIRARRHFTTIQMQRLSGAAYDTVREYISKLERDGYVKRTGRDGHQITWMLIKGHKQIQRPATKEKADV